MFAHNTALQSTLMATVGPSGTVQPLPKIGTIIFLASLSSMYKAQCATSSQFIAGLQRLVDCVKGVFRSCATFNKMSKRRQDRLEVLERENEKLRRRIAEIVAEQSSAPASAVEDAVSETYDFKDFLNSIIASSATEIHEGGVCRKFNHPSAKLRKKKWTVSYSEDPDDSTRLLIDVNDDPVEHDFPSVLQNNAASPLSTCVFKHITLLCKDPDFIRITGNLADGAETEIWESAAFFADLCVQ